MIRWLFCLVSDIKSIQFYTILDDKLKKKQTIILKLTLIHISLSPSDHIFYFTEKMEANNNELLYSMPHD